MLTRFALLGRIGAAVVALFALTIAGATPANSYSSDEVVEISDSSPAPGAPLTVGGGGFGAGTTVTIVIYSSPVTLGTAVANAAGEVSTSVTIPSSFSAGSSHRIELQGVDPDGNSRVISQSIVLEGGSSLAATGATIIPLAAGGAALFALGAILVATGRLRRSKATQ